MKKNIKLIIALVGIVAVFVVLWLVMNSSNTEEPESYPLVTSSNTTHDVSVIYINAGKADSILVQIDEFSYLIDCGLKKSFDKVEQVLDKYNVKKLDAIFLTHTHKDHIGGIKKIAKKYEIAALYGAEISMDDKDGTNAIEKKADAINMPLKKLMLGDRVSLVEDVCFEVLGPISYNDDDDNDNSLVLRMYVNNRVFLFTGDMQFAEEKTLFDKGIDVSADILKVANHGNPDATSKKFAGCVSPEVAIITTDTSEDANSANKKVIGYLNDAQVYVTQNYELGVRIIVDEQGNISVVEA